MNNTPETGQEKPKKKLRIQSTHSDDERGLDPYFTCPEATLSLLHLERAYLPRVICDPCAGDGAITRELDRRGLEGCVLADYRTLQLPPEVEGIITNFPYKKALQFAEKAVREVGYVALLVRCNFLTEGARRDRFLEEHPPVRTYYSSQRYPMMHRLNWPGKKSSSNTPYSWAVWDRRANHIEPPRRFRWREIMTEYEAGRLDLGPSQ
jgi:hypothetical protein